MVNPINHLRNRVDALTWRVEQTQESDELRRLALECGELERAIQLRESELLREVADLETGKAQLRRLKSRL